MRKAAKISHGQMSLAESPDRDRPGEMSGDRFHRSFYELQYQGEGYRTFGDDSPHEALEKLRGLIQNFNLQSGRVLEVGCGRGAFQDLVADYTGVDIARAAAEWIHKKFLVASAWLLPFSDNYFDSVWNVMP